MLKLLLLIFGFVTGAGATTAWLLSEPNQGEGPVVPTDKNSLQGRAHLVKARWDEAVSLGEQRGHETEQQLRFRLDQYRKT
jgi:hypothetical protein